MYDIKNGTIQNDAFAGTSNACNGLCLPGGVLATCQVSLDFASNNTVNYGTTHFSSIQQAIDLCVYGTITGTGIVPITVLPSNNVQNIGPGGLTVFWEDLRFSRADG